VGEIALKHSFMKGAFFGLKSEDMDTPRAYELFKLSSPITSLTQDDPPVWAYYGRPKDPPINVNDAIHHINFGLHLKEQMDTLGIECTIRSRDDVKAVQDECVEFFLKHFGLYEDKK